MSLIPVDLTAIAPEIILVVGASLLLLIGVFLPERTAARFGSAWAAVTLVAAGLAAALQFNDSSHWSFDHTLRIDAFGAGAQLIIFAAGLLTVCVSFGAGGAIHRRAVEYYALLLFASGGMALLAAANSFVILFVALELFSIALYVLVAIETDEITSIEAGLKYLIIGSVGAAFLLYGSALVYGASGQLEFDRIATAMRAGDHADVVLLAGISMVLVGLGFKANAAPFHMWTPDAYEGAPTPVTTFMSAATKAIALVVILRVLVTAFPDQSHVWSNGVAAIAIASFIIGNLGALRQRNVKRMLAYSTVGHTGFLLTAVAADSRLGTRALLYYLTVYAAMNIGAFAIVAVRERQIGRPVEIADFSGWGYRHRWLGAAMFVCMLSLAGFPPSGGFIGKLYIFSAAVENDQTYLAVIGVIATMVALIYYLRIPLALYEREATAPTPAPAPATNAAFRLLALAATVAALAVLVAGIVPSPLIDLARTASNSLFS
jgi:NADH-quinone oxidoreductase subunit N